MFNMDYYIIHSLKSNSYFKRKVMYVQFGFLHLILTRKEFTKAGDTERTPSKKEQRHRAREIRKEDKKVRLIKEKEWYREWN